MSLPQKQSKKSRKRQADHSDDDKDDERQNPHHHVDSSMTVSETCDFIAQLSESILQDPESALGPQMRQLFDLTRQKDEYISKLVVLSLLAIFQDILPSFRIRIPTPQEMAVRVSKETKKLWDYERNLLAYYQEYLKFLDTTWKQKQSSVKTPLQITCMLALCQLLQTQFHFNFRSNLVTLVVRHMNYAGQVGKACCHAIEQVFERDAQGQVALEAARQVAKLVNTKTVRPAVLRTFLALPLRVHADEAAQMAAKAKKKRKQQKELAAIDAELKESQAVVDKLVLAQCQAETLQTITLTYFRVIKSCSNTETSQDKKRKKAMQTLLPAALEGLAKFAHLINMDTVLDLLAVLKELLKDVNVLPLEAGLNCILTAFQTLQGPGKELKIDFKEYIVPLYNLLPRLCSDETSTNLMLQCLQCALIQRREFSTIRVAAFFKQILGVSLHTTPHTSVALLSLARQLLTRYQALEQLLENEQDVVTSGEYNATALDPEHSNPFSTSAWELALLKFHFHSQVSESAMGAATGKALQLPERLRAQEFQDANELAIEFVRMKKKHPLAMKQEPKKKRQRQVRFITPRAQELHLIHSNELN